MIHQILFESSSTMGRIFDIVLIIAIILSLLAVMLESVEKIENQYGEILRIVEWILTVLFTIEFLLRLYSVQRPFKYMFSFYGLVDLISILPTYFDLILSGSHYMLSIRIIRVLRIFRILKLSRHVHESRNLFTALKSSMPKITVFLGSIMTITIIMGTLMYLIEGREHGFTSIPKGVYWVIVTMTTVGYGDISPQTPIGQFISSLLMVIGYGIIAVPTGIVTAQMTNSKRISNIACLDCGSDIHDADANYCRICGCELQQSKSLSKK